MTLAEKIITLRKQFGWSQENLAEKLQVSRQSVSKWESANSTPELDKITKLAHLFNVSTDFLLKQDVHVNSIPATDSQHPTTGISQQQANQYINYKVAASVLTANGVFLCLCAIAPLLLLFLIGVKHDLAVGFGIMTMITMLCIATSWFIKVNTYKQDTSNIDKASFTLDNGVRETISKQSTQFREHYARKLGSGVFLCVASFLPLMLVNVIAGFAHLTLLMIVFMLAMIGLGVRLMAPAAAQYQAYNHVLKQSTEANCAREEQQKRTLKLAAFYWPLLIALFLAWSLWTMNWHKTWIILPIGAVLFISLVGLMELLRKAPKED